jgi:NAD(P)-dependent dehydrogenase (short-subunit alcohol dehydrogenase family)
MKSNLESPFSLSGKNILVTGASSGIGKECAIQCSYQGANLLITGRDQIRLHETYNLLQSGKNFMITADLENDNDCESLAKFAKDKFESIDGFIHSAGIEKTLPFNNMKPKQYEVLFRVNVISGFDLLRQLIKHKCLSGTGSSIVYIASIMGIVGQPGKVGYCSSKAALVNGVKALALELAPQKIRINSILPGVCRTRMAEDFLKKLTHEAQLQVLKMHPLGFGDPADVALSAIFLLSDASKWVTGTGLVVDGGYSAM